MKLFTKQDIFDFFEGKKNTPDWVKKLKQNDKKFYRTEFIYKNKKCVALRTPRDGGFCIKIDIPEGFTADDLNLKVSFGNGYNNMDKL